MDHSSRCRSSTPRIRSRRNTTSASIACRSTTRTRPDCTGRFRKAAAFTTTKPSVSNQPLPVTVFLGGPPALILAAIAPLPEDVPELVLASLLAGQKLKMTRNPLGADDIVSQRKRSLRLSDMRRRTNDDRKDHSAITTVTTRCVTIIRSSMSTRSFIVAMRSIRRLSSASRGRKISSSATTCRSCCRRCFRS